MTTPGWLPPQKVGWWAKRSPHILASSVTLAMVGKTPTLAYGIRPAGGSLTLTGSTPTVTVAPAVIGYVGSSTAEATTVSVPGHLTGHLIIIFAVRDAGDTTIPSLPAGWTSIATNSSSFIPMRVGYKIAASGSETSGTWTNATGLVCHVYREASGIGASTSTTGSSGSAVTYPSLSLNVTNGSSWVAGFGGHQDTTGNMGVAPGAMTNRSNLAGSVVDAAGHDTNGGVASWSSANANPGSATTGFVTAVVEILE